MVKKRENYHSPTSLFTFINNDSLCYLLEKRKKTNNNKDIQEKTVLDYVLEEGINYEKMIINKIYEKAKQNKEEKNIVNIENEGLTEDEYYNKTKDIIKSEKYDLILGGVLYNKDNKTYGHPDMIVSDYWLEKYINKIEYTDKHDNCRIYNKKIYYIIDIKGTTINLIKGGKNICDSKDLEVYKMQIYIYTLALNRIQNNKQRLLNGFILGKKYVYQENNEKVVLLNPFETLGFIDYELMRKKYDKKIKEAINLKKTINKNYKKYSLNPIRKEYLLPNMRNKFDKNMKTIKKEIAKYNKEITSLYGCGIKHRERAKIHGINNYGDKRLTPEILGINVNHKKYNIISKLLKNNKLIEIPEENNYNNWREQVDNEFYVDFETFISEEYKSDENNNLSYTNKQILYMIGVGYKSCINMKDRWTYKYFILEGDTNNKSQKALINNFVDFINSFNKDNLSQEEFYEKTRLYHWSSAEKIIYNKKVNEYNFLEEKYELPWFDLLNVFRNYENPIIIKDCHSYSLKSVVNKLNEYKMLDIKWNELNDGYLSAIMAKNLYLGYEEELRKNKLLNEIILYNEVDCKAIYSLLDFIRIKN